MTHTIYTAGYSGWNHEHLISEVRRLDAVLVDIRLNPRSRLPQWHGHNLNYGVNRVPYHYVSELGNLNYKGGPIKLKNPELGVQLVSNILKRSSIVLLCACGDVSSCHRLVAARLLHEHTGAPIEHLVPSVKVKSEIIKALSLNPPYGSLIAVSECFPHLGKHYETRSWTTRYRGRLLIHQTKGLGGVGWREFVRFCSQRRFMDSLETLGYKHPADLPLGALVAVAELTDCIRVTPLNAPTGLERFFGNYTLSQERYMWKLENIKRIDPPILARGAQGLWDWHGELNV